MVAFVNTVQINTAADVHIPPLNYDASILNFNVLIGSDLNYPKYKFDFDETFSSSESRLSELSKLSVFSVSCNKLCDGVSICVKSKRNIFLPLCFSSDIGRVSNHHDVNDLSLLSDQRVVLNDSYLARQFLFTDHCGRP